MPERTSGAGALVVGTLVTLLAACGGRGDPGSGPAPAAACIVLEGTGPDAGARAPTRPSPTVGIVDRLDPRNAPVPENPGEEFVFGALYEPLVRMDCTGRIVPALAAAWEEEDRGRRWTFTLREGARFWNGDPVTARDVTRSWREAEDRGRDPWGSMRPLSVQVLDDRRLRVTLSRPWSRPPTILTAPALAVTRSTDGGAWPRSGTGPYRPASLSTPVAGGADAENDVLLELVSPGPASDLHSPIRIRIDPDADPRDLLDAGADLLLTGDPETVEYADLRPALSTRPLPWSRRYMVVLATPLSTGETVAAPSATFLEGLARDVARQEARPATGAGCLLAPLPLSRTTGGGSRIGYDPEDPTARALAERLVALAAASARNGVTEDALRSVGLADAPPDLVAVPTGSDAAEALQPGERARLLGVARRPDAACGGPAISDPRIVPLVDTRRRVVSRGAPLTLAVDGAGAPRIVGSRVVAGDSDGGDP